MRPRGVIPFGLQIHKGVMILLLYERRVLQQLHESLYVFPRICKMKG